MAFQSFVLMHGEEQVAMVVGFVVLEFCLWSSALGLLKGYLNVKEFASGCRQGLAVGIQKCHRVARISSWLCVCRCVFLIVLVIVLVVVFVVFCL